jgi:DNA-directed RNA polymerase specialized sigma24 family protein
MMKTGLASVPHGANSDNVLEHDQERLHVVPNENRPAPYDEPILQQILEAVQRVADAALRAAPAHDAMVSAEDIAQDTMATLHQRGHPEATINLVAWTIGIAKFKLKEAARRSRQQAPQVPLLDDDQVVPSTDAQVQSLMHYVWLLDHLAPLDRMIVEWRQAGFSSREVANELQRNGYPHMTANNVDQRFYRALKTLRARIFSTEGP